MIYCSSLYTQWHLDAKSKEAPCCFYNTRGQTVNLAADRGLMQNGQWPSNCEYCQLSEIKGSRSPRLDYTGRVRASGVADYQESLHSISVFLGNKCNLHCATCDAKYSTGWIKIAPEFGVESAPHVGFDTMRLDGMKHRLGNLRELHVMGGEPFYQDDLSKLIDYLSDLELDKCLLRITTNGVTTPSAGLLQRLDRFREVHLSISIDGLGDRYEYLRHPAVWQDLIGNIAQFRNMPKVTQMNMNSTVSMANCWDIEEVATWGVRTFGTNFEFNMARKVQWELSNLPAALKQDWFDRFGHRSWARTIASHVAADPTDSDGWQRFRAFVDQWDLKWNLDFASTFPEWTAAIKKHNLW